MQVLARYIKNSEVGQIRPIFSIVGCEADI